MMNTFLRKIFFGNLRAAELEVRNIRRENDRYAYFYRSLLCVRLRVYVLLCRNSLFCLRPCICIIACDFARLCRHLAISMASTSSYLCIRIVVYKSIDSCFYYVFDFSRVIVYDYVFFWHTLDYYLVYVF